MIAIYYRTNQAIARDPLFLDVAYATERPTLDRDDYVFVTNLPDVDRLTDAFQRMNVIDGTEEPVRLKVRSMMVGDVVVEEDGDVWICCILGWKQASW